MSAPIKKFSAGSVQVAVWENQAKEGNTFQTVSVNRVYKDNSDNWKNSSSLKVNDLPKAIAALQKAYEYLVLKEPELQQEKAMATAIE